jgi:hypothetical protein
MSDPIEQKLRQFIALSDTPVTLTTFLDALLAEHRAVLPVDKVREVLRAARGIHGANVDEVLTTCAEVLGVHLGAKCDCGHTSIGSNSLCMAPVRTAGGSIAACGCSHPSHAMPAKAARGPGDDTGDGQ